ncbi:MAG: hypothetical protein A2086_02555 [Spirochaetes bacterium GWD1_27_9]|nr:MAG: hypothetical protein A2Z98_04880 [Spirochaetes bacterium GWB1_27_13]OHD23060.1 MAG: hypothetical protein A2Y34_17925 [Spirochaetes bacterium GWC1_27_15]OHD31624.1 MAG: hypothetical protein A2086_02555 [Spirochaetes bacterium GWD1_27_9]
MKDDIIFGNTLDLNEWLRLLFSSQCNKVFPNNCFPTNKMLEDFIKNINNYNDDYIKNILRKLLVHTGSYGSDYYQAKYVLHDKDNFINKIKETEYYRRLFTKGEQTWEGITWILDFLPDLPNDAINSLDLYFFVNCLFLPDNALSGLSDAMEIIRAKYLYKNNNIESLYNLKPKEFEIIICKLYEEMGYSTSLTSDSYDGGIDINAFCQDSGKKEKILIQCKKYKNNIGIEFIRSLLGVVSDNKATKGVLVSTSDFTSQSKKLSNNNGRIELINGSNLNLLLNKYFGSNWPIKIDKILLEYKTENKFNK